MIRKATHWSCFQIRIRRSAVCIWVSFPLYIYIYVPFLKPSTQASHWCLGEQSTCQKGCPNERNTALPNVSALLHPRLSSLHHQSNTCWQGNICMCCIPHHSWCVCSLEGLTRSHSRDPASQKELCHSWFLLHVYLPWVH